MKLLVFAHHLELGGTQTNAIEMAATLRDTLGWDVVLHAAPGPSLALLRKKGLRYIEAADVRLHPSPRRVRDLRRLVRDEKPDLIHCWDWWQGLEAYVGVHLPMGVPLVISDMMMFLTRVLPRQVPTTFGFEHLCHEADAAGFRSTHFLPPPVDVHANAPGVGADPRGRAAFGILPGEIAVVTVSRLAENMKSESIERTIRTIGKLGRDLPLKFVLVGDGLARPRLQALADETNAALGRDAVLLHGAMNDPRAAYDVADIVVGMGGSSLRGLSYAKPVVVVGEYGFARLFTPDTAEPFFRDTGMYGLGDGSPDNGTLEEAILRLAHDPALRDDLGRFGRDFVVLRHGLESVTRAFARFCEAAIAEAPRRRSIVGDAARTAAIYLRERRFLTASRDKIPVRP